MMFQLKCTFNAVNDPPEKHAAGPKSLHQGAPQRINRNGTAQALNCH